MASRGYLVKGDDGARSNIRADDTGAIIEANARVIAEIFVGDAADDRKQIPEGIITNFGGVQFIGSDLENEDGIAVGAIWASSGKRQKFQPHIHPRNDYSCKP